MPAAGHAAYPDRPIRLIISSAAGGSPDVVTRILCVELGKQLGQQIVIDNRPGGAQTIGTEMMVHAIPGGYTLGYANVVTLAINKTLLPVRQPDLDLAAREGGEAARARGERTAAFAGFSRSSDDRRGRSAGLLHPVHPVCFSAFPGFQGI